MPPPAPERRPLNLEGLEARVKSMRLRTGVESPSTVRRVVVATIDEIEQLQNTFVGHFGGVTVHHQTPAALRGVGARDPVDVPGTLEQNEHVAFEVYAAAVQESDDYFRAVRR